MLLDSQLLKCNLNWTNYSNACFSGDASAVGGGINNPNCKITRKDAATVKKFTQAEASKRCGQINIDNPDSTTYQESRERCSRDLFPSEDGLVLSKSGSSIAKKDIEDQFDKRVEGVNTLKNLNIGLIAAAATIAVGTISMPNYR